MKDYHTENFETQVNLYATNRKIRVTIKEKQTTVE